jgi:hypothetical protein
MKFVIHILLLCLYMSGSSGLNVQFHYCGDDLSSFSILLPASDCCDCEGNSNCCSNESIVFKASDDHPPLQNTDFQLYSALPETHYANFYSPGLTSLAKDIPLFFEDLPPPRIHLLNAVWII